MGLLGEVQAEEVPSHPVEEEVIVVVAVDTVEVATVAEEIAAVAIAEAEIEAVIVEVAIEAAAAVTEVAVVDDLLLKSTPLPLEELPSPMAR